MPKRIACLLVNRVQIRDLTRPRCRRHSPADGFDSMAVDQCRPRFKIALQLGFLSRISFNQVIEIAFANPEHGGDFGNAHSLAGNIRKPRAFRRSTLKIFPIVFAKETAKDPVLDTGRIARAYPNRFLRPPMEHLSSMANDRTTLAAAAPE